MKQLKTPISTSGLALLLCLTISGCQMLLTKPMPISVTGLTFQNTANNDAENVRLRSLATNGQVSCNKIEINSTCGTGFPAKYYQAGELELSWQMAGRSYAEHFVIPIPTDAEKNQKYTAVVLFTNNGQYDVRLTKNNTL